MNNKNVRYDENNKLKRKLRVTVCIAAIYNGNSVLGASDRMLTAGDIEFEPPQTKILPITNSIVIMTAGDSNIQTQVYSKTYDIVGEKIKLNPKRWVSVSDVADIYSDCFLNLRAKISEKEILAPYMLNHKAFIARQKEMSPVFIDKISDAIERFSIEEVETIITGIDETGVHIYVGRNGIMGCADKIGFASIGIGSNHALSHFMLSRYTRNASVSKALLTVHQAKKKSEVSPGVGKETDMFVIGPSLGSFIMISLPIVETQQNIVKDLDGFYKRYKQKIERLDKYIEGKIEDYVNKLAQPSSSKQEVGSSPSPSPSLEEGE